jgi:hypothetical protein
MHLIAGLDAFSVEVVRGGGRGNFQTGRDVMREPLFAMDAFVSRWRISHSQAGSKLRCVLLVDGDGRE